MSGSTPLLAFVNPLILFYQAGLYGSGAILAREVVRRRGLGWTSLLILGAAYGVLEEALVVQSWFDPYWPAAHALGYNGRWLDTNWIWATALTMFHMVFSITIPVLLVETAYRDQRPWLNNLGVGFFTLVLAAVSLFGLYGFGFVTFKKAGYAHPPVEWFGALLLALGLVWLALSRRQRPARVVEDRPPPGLWRLRCAAFVATLLWFCGLWVLPNLLHVGVLPVLELGFVFVVSAILLRRWSSRPGWNRRHRLALASGGLGFIIAYSPVAEAGGTRGILLVGLACLGLLVWLGRRERASQDEAVVPAGAG